MLLPSLSGYWPKEFDSRVITQVAELLELPRREVKSYLRDTIITEKQVLLLLDLHSSWSSFWGVVWFFSIFGSMGCI